MNNIYSLRNSVIWFSGKSLNCCHQMSDIKANMHQIQFRLGLRLQTPLGELRSTFCMKLYRHEASRSLFATAELLVWLTPVSMLVWRIIRHTCTVHPFIKMTALQEWPTFPHNRKRVSLYKPHACYAALRQHLSDGHERFSYHKQTVRHYLLAYLMALRTYMY